MKNNKKFFQEFLQVVLAIEDINLLEKFLRDLLTPAEFEEIVVRWQIVRELQKGTPQREIAKKLGVGIATVTRGSRMLQNKKGGFNEVLRQYEKSKK